ncbi:MAG: hypothetical protein ACUVR0_01135 [Candidatus Aminicenantales bacterium]
MKPKIFWPKSAKTTSSKKQPGIHIKPLCAKHADKIALKGFFSNSARLPISFEPGFSEKGEDLVKKASAALAFQYSIGLCYLPFDLGKIISLCQ